MHASNVSNLSFWAVIFLFLAISVGAEGHNDCNANAVSLLQSNLELAQVSKSHTHTVSKSQKSVAAKCLNVTSWQETVSKEKPWHKYSQGDQDSILASLFNEAHLGTTNKFSVEFGFPDPSKPYKHYEYSTTNTGLLKEHGWKIGLRLDGDVESSAKSEAINLHQEWITPENVAQLFDKYDVPHEPDYVSIDIDSCDIWVFLNLTEKYRPRALSVEYNAKYSLDEKKVNVCKDSAGSYAWNGDDMFGASLASLHKAAEKMGYTMVASEMNLDVFLVRSDLVCPGTELPIEFFRKYTNSTFGNHRKGNATEVNRWIVDY